MKRIVLGDRRAAELRCRGWRQEGLLRLWRTCSRSARIPTISSSMRRSARPRATGPRTTAIVETLKTIGRGPDAAHPVRQADRPAEDPRQGAAGHHGQLQHRRPMGEGRVVLRAREEGPDLLGRAHRRRLAVYRHPGRHPGHLRDLHAHRRAAFRRRPRRPVHPDRRARRHGRRAAARRHAWPTLRSSASRSIETRIDKRKADRLSSST